MASKQFAIPEETFLKFSPPKFSLVGTDHPEDDFHANPLNNSPLFRGQILSSKLLTTVDAVKKTVHVEIDVTHSEFKFLPGDAFGLVCENDTHIVEMLLERLKVPQNDKSVYLLKALDPSFEKDIPKQLKKPFTLRGAFLRHCDLTTMPKKNFLRMLAEYCSDSAEKSEFLFWSSTSAEGKRSYQKNIEDAPPTLLQLLKRFGSCQPPVVHLLEMLPPLQPRYYSAANSLLAHPNRIHLAYTVVEIPSSDGSMREGVCTKWLNEKCSLASLTDLKISEKSSSSSNFPFLSLFLRTPNTFHPPEDLSKPIIMIGPGTGVAPFRGFLQHFEAIKKADPNAKIGNTWLFFGCRNESKDFLYRDELNAFLRNGTLTRLISAFSRDTPEEVSYVSHRLVENGKEVLRMMCDEKGTLFVCGDAKGMTKGVMDALLQIIKTNMIVDDKKAMEIRGEWMKEKRFLLDVWA